MKFPENLKLLNGRILIELTEEENTTESGLVISAGEVKKWRGRVLHNFDVYQDERGVSRSCPVEVGDEVWLARFSGLELPYPYKGALAVYVNDIVAVVPASDQKAQARFDKVV